MYGFGPESENELQTQGDPDPKGFRKWMGEVSETLKELRAENEALRTEKAQQTVRDALTAQGYAPGVASLYTGAPEGLNDWLSANGALFVKADAAGGQQQTHQGPPATVVSPESQAALAAMSAAGSDGVPALGGDDALQARLEAAQTPEEFNAIMRENGNVRFR